MEERLTAWSVWLRDERRLADHTCRAYQSDTLSFFVFLASHLGAPVDHDNLRDLHLTDLRAFLAKRTHQGLRARGRARALSAVRSLMGFLADRDGLDLPALALLRRPRIAPSLPKAVDRDNLLRLLAFDDQRWQTARDRALFGLLYGSGLRLAEALSLDINDLDTSRRKSPDDQGNQSDRSRTAVLRITGKGARTRLVPLVPQVGQWINDYRRQCPFHQNASRHGNDSSIPLFVGARAGRLNPGVARARLKHLAQQLNLPRDITPHALRHSFATHLLQSSGRLRVIQELLGHESLRATQVYVGVAPTQLRDIHQKSHPRYRLSVTKK